MEDKLKVILDDHYGETKDNDHKESVIEFISSFVPEISNIIKTIEYKNDTEALKFTALYKLIDDYYGDYRTNHHKGEITEFILTYEDKIERYLDLELE